MMADPKSTESDKEYRIPRGAVELDDPNLFINRELSWLQFNHRVLEEAMDASNPLLERVKFASIFASNLDEFFMVRVSGLRIQMSATSVSATSDGMTPSQQLAAIRRELLPELESLSLCWHNDLLPALKDANISVHRYTELKTKQRKLLRRYFRKEVFPTLTPLAFDPGHPFPHISNLSMNLAVVVRDPEHGERFARLKVPGILPRLLRIPGEESAESYESLGLAKAMSDRFVWMEEVVAANLDMLFPGLEVESGYAFRVTRDADQEIEEDEAADLLSAMEEVVGMRHFGSVVRLEVDVGMPDRIKEILTTNLGLAPYQVYTTQGPLGMANIMELTDIDRPDLKHPPFQPVVHPRLSEGSLFSAIKRQDMLLYHPYDSFTPVIDFLREAARDPDVLAIKQTLYRVGTNSPVVAALMEARENGKQVAVLVELKARFDEERNIEWARALERAGVHVVYGLLGLKTHAKICLVVRREGDDIARFVHLATGNYNEVTARIYTDLGFFTHDDEIATDVTNLFNALTGYSRVQSYQKLVVSPGNTRQAIIDRIDREIEFHQKSGNGALAFKMNSLVDKRIIKALYRASQAGVPIRLQVRGVCCLRPGVPGVSENIHVTSVVGRFLEHVRIYHFGNDGNDELLIGSADLMPRNLDRRVETLFPVEDERLKVALRDSILKMHLRDTAKARRLLPDGNYEHIVPAEGETKLDSQRWMIEHRGVWHAEGWA